MQTVVADKTTLRIGELKKWKTRQTRITCSIYRSSFKMTGSEVMATCDRDVTKLSGFAMKSRRISYQTLNCKRRQIMMPSHETAA